MMSANNYSDSESTDSFETCHHNDEEEEECSRLEEAVNMDLNELFVPIKIRRLEIPKAPFITELKRVQKLKLNCHNEQLHKEHCEQSNNERSLRNKTRQQIKENDCRSLDPDEYKSFGKIPSINVLKKVPLVTISTWTESRQCGHSSNLSQEMMIASNRHSTEEQSTWKCMKSTKNDNHLIEDSLQLLKYLSLLKSFPGKAQQQQQQRPNIKSNYHEQKGMEDSTSRFY